jgi:tetratricopeptide (TPR) repeat protein
MSRKRVIHLSIAFIIIAALVGGGFAVYCSAWNQERIFAALVASRSAEDRAGIEQLLRSAKEWEAKSKDAVDAVALTEAARHWKAMGDVYQLRYPREKAIALYERAMEQFGDSATLYSAMGDTYKAMEEYEQAEEQYQRAIALEPGQFTHYLKLTTLYRYRMNAAPDQILSVFAAALQRLIIGSSDVYKERALYFESLGSYKAAAQDWKAVMQLEPTNTGASAEYERLTALANEKDTVR